jgi:hypothetical protein
MILRKRHITLSHQPLKNATVTPWSALPRIINSSAFDSITEDCFHFSAEWIRVAILIVDMMH